MDLNYENKKKYATIYVSQKKGLLMLRNMLLENQLIGMLLLR